ncbi:MAG: calcium-binding protein [Cyclobacteriaceae bacterium]
MDYEIVVDAHSEDEVKMSWYYHLCDNMNFPFEAYYHFKRKNGGAKKRKVQVLEMLSEDMAGDRMAVGIAYDEDVFYVPLLDLEDIEADEETLEVINDWRYWNERGYQW